MRPRFALKAATEDLHEALDSRLSQLNLADAGDYGKFLAVQAAVLPGLERALSAAGLGDLVRGWEDGRRADRLLADMTVLEMPQPKAVQPPLLPSKAAALGAAYVLEGSRLGAKVLVQHTDPNLSQKFLGADVNSNPWPALVTVLDRELSSPDELDEAARAARATFTAFLSAASSLGIN